MQENDRHALGTTLVGQAQASDGQLDARIGAVAGLDPVDVFAEVAAALGTEQRDGELGAAALHGFTNL